MRPDVQYLPAALFYLLYVAAPADVRRVAPAVRRGAATHAWVRGTFFGLTAYTAYDLTSLAVMRDFPVVAGVVDMVWGAMTIAEDSTAWPMVSRPVYLGGLGFGMKWDMGWMHDTLAYFQLDGIHRRYHHQKVTFRMMYAFSENSVLSISHDEVVHMKSSLLHEMAGDPWQQRANLRALLGYIWA